MGNQLFKVSIYANGKLQQTNYFKSLSLASEWVDAHTFTTNNCEGYKVVIDKVESYATIADNQLNLFEGE